MTPSPIEVITPGYKYVLPNFEDKEVAGQTLQFIEKEPEHPGSTTLVTKNDGTTNEALIEVLIDRITFQQERMSDRFGGPVLNYLKQALAILNERTNERKERGVEGTGAL